MDHDVLTPFMLENATVRGRIVRLHASANTILTRHAYPDVVSKVLGEALVIASMLSSQLKQDGIFTLQIRGDGPISLLVVDAVYGGALRGYADIMPEHEAKLRASASISLRDLFGQNSYFAITLDPGEGMQRYQGVVALEGDTLADALQAYFTHSQQLAVQCITASARTDSGQWQAGGMMIEHIADTGGVSSLEADAEDSWRYAQAMLRTVSHDELLSDAHTHDSLLLQLFHESGVIMYPQHALSVGCRCSRERIYDLLMSMPIADRMDTLVDGKTSVHCQFCNQTEVFLPNEIGLSLN
jgi:molecular chaperone Hsp33